MAVPGVPPPHQCDAYVLLRAGIGQVVQQQQKKERDWDKRNNKEPGDAGKDGNLKHERDGEWRGLGEREQITTVPVVVYVF